MRGLRLAFSIFLGVCVASPVWATDCDDLLARRRSPAFFPSDFSDLDLGTPEAQELRSAYLRIGAQSTQKDHKRLADALIAFLRQKGVRATASQLGPKSYFVRISPKYQTNLKSKHWLARMAVALWRWETDLGFDTSSADSSEAAGWMGHSPMRIALTWDNVDAPHLTPGGIHELTHFKFTQSDAVREAEAFDQTKPGFRVLAPATFYFKPSRAFADQSTERLYGKKEGHHSDENDAYLKDATVALVIGERLTREMQQGRLPEDTFESSRFLVKQHLKGAQYALELADVIRSKDLSFIRYALKYPERWKIESSGGGVTLRIGSAEMMASELVATDMKRFLIEQQVRLEQMERQSKSLYERLKEARKKLKSISEP